MPAKIFRASLAAVAAVLFILAGSHPFAVGLPMVGEVALGTPGEGGSGLSWAGDARLLTSASLLLLAAIVTVVHWRYTALWLSGVSLGWIGAFALGGVTWYAEQTEMLRAMGIDPSRIDFELGSGCSLWIGALLFSACFSIWSFAAYGKQSHNHGTEPR